MVQRVLRRFHALTSRVDWRATRVVVRAFASEEDSSADSWRPNGSWVVATSVPHRSTFSQTVGAWIVRP